jgi:hypothetical protein
MRALWTVARVAVGLLAIAVTFVTVLWVDGPSGRQIDTTGAVLDAVAVVVLLAVIWSLWRDRARLF